MNWLAERLYSNDLVVLNDRERLSRHDLLRLWRDTAPEQGRFAFIEGDFSGATIARLLSNIEANKIIVPLSFASQHLWDYYREVVTTPNELYSQLSGAGLVLFSSGSTGKPKAALHSFNRLLEKFKAPRPAYRMLTFLLLDHIGGINTLFAALAGGSVVTVSGRDPDTVCQAIEKHRVQVLPTSPTFLNLLLLSEAYKRYDLSSLELVTYGTELMPETTLRRVKEALPNVRLHQTYGLSELGILRSKSGEGLWVKVGGEGYETKVENDTLWIKAQSAMLGYLNAPSPFIDGWFDTGDMVEQNGEYIRFLGRKSEIINVGGQKVYPVEVESVLLEMPGVQDAVVYGEPNALMGQIVAAKIVGDPTGLREYCAGKLERYKIPVRVMVVETLTGARFKKVRK